MDAAGNWQLTNEQYLAAGLTWLRLRLLHLIGRRSSATSALDPQSEALLTQAEEIMSACEALDQPPPLFIIRQRFGLSRFEQDMLLLCVALELDTGLAALCAQAQGNPNQTYPTFALALALFDQPAWDILSPERPLRYWRLIEVIQSGALPLTSSPLRADERIVNYVKGLNYLDDRLIPLLTPLHEANVEVELPPSQQAVVEQVVRFLHRSPQQQRVPLIQLLGIDPTSKELIAWYVASTLGMRVYYLPLDLIPIHTADMENLARLWQRESLLLPLALYIDAHDVDEESANIAAKLGRFLVRSDGLFFLGTRDVYQDLRRVSLDVDVAKPTADEQKSAWTTVLGHQHSLAPARLSAQFNLGLAAIYEVAQSVAAESGLNGHRADDLLWEACLARTRPRLDTLAERLEPKATWDDIVLQEHTFALLHQIANQVRQRGNGYDEWGVPARLSQTNESRPRYGNAVCR